MVNKPGRLQELILKLHTQHGKRFVLSQLANADGQSAWYLTFTTLRVLYIYTRKDSLYCKKNVLDKMTSFYEHFTLVTLVLGSDMKPDSIAHPNELHWNIEYRKVEIPNPSFLSLVQQESICHPLNQPHSHRPISCKRVWQWERYPLFYMTFYSTRWFKYDRDWLCVNKSQFVPVIFEPPCIFLIRFRLWSL